VGVFVIFNACGYFNFISKSFVLSMCISVNKCKQCCFQSYD
jgi:hypothetical protein